MIGSFRTTFSKKLQICKKKSYLCSKKRMKKRGCIKKGDVLYWTLDELSLSYGFSKRQLANYVSLGALVRVRLPEGLYFRIDEGWELVDTWVFAKKAVREVVAEKPMSEDDYLWIFAKEEVMCQERIDEEEFDRRVKLKLYLPKGQRWMFRSDKEWKNLTEYKREKWSHVTHGDEFVFKKI